MVLIAGVTMIIVISQGNDLLTWKESIKRKRKQNNVFDREKKGLNGKIQ